MHRYEKLLDELKLVIAMRVPAEEDAREVVEALRVTDWAFMMEMTRDGVNQTKCPTCGYIYMLRKNPSLNVCPRCDPEKERERAKVRGFISLDLTRDANRRMRQGKIPHIVADPLTLEIWVATLDYFDWKCAYCLTSPYLHLDHFLPLHLEGRSSIGNCVPACRLCNNKKSNTHPDKVRKISREDMERVQAFLHIQYTLA